ncbi:MAG: arsenate reductase [Aquisalimonadaceae bacterium]
MIELYGIGNCDTCRKARKYLDGIGAGYRFHDLRVDGLDRALVERWLGKAGADALVNRRSTTWRQFSEAQRAQADDDRLPDLLVQHPTLVKRPVLEAGDQCLVGFRQAEYDQLPTS